MDALYFRVSSDRPTTENQLDELVAAARAGDPVRDWDRIRAELGRSIIAEIRTTRRATARTVYQVDEAVARRLADQCIYVEQGRSGARDMRDVITTVYELADLGITIVPLKSQTGFVNTVMGRLLWAIQGWYAEMENEERSENVKAGQARARAQGKEIGRPREIDAVKAEEIARLRALGLGYSTIAKAAGVSRTTVRRILKVCGRKAA